MLPKTPAKGMRDFLPDEYALRQHILATIQKTYESYGFTRIETPAVENISLLTSKQGGDNEKLIFKILKRGEKLTAADSDDLCDLGLRYDLTVPLSRFYANNVGQLPSVFKAMQMDNVWRADRPQRGRFRQFMQCDIDIIGEQSNLAETELISATMQALDNLGFQNVTVRLSDRRLLNALAEKCGFSDEQKPSVFITLDKLDKIGVTGVMQEIDAIAPGKATEFVNLINRITSAPDPFGKCVEELGAYLPAEVAQNVEQILYVTNNLVQNGKVVFDVTLVRGIRVVRGRFGHFRGRRRQIRQDDRAHDGDGRTRVRFQHRIRTYCNVACRARSKIRGVARERSVGRQKPRRQANGGRNESMSQRAAQFQRHAVAQNQEFLFSDQTVDRTRLSNDL